MPRFLLIVVLAIAAPTLLKAQTLVPVHSVIKSNRALMIIEPQATDRQIPHVTNSELCGDVEWLSPRGRAQTRKIAEALKSSGLKRAQIYTSTSCAAIQAAKMLDVGRVRIRPLLDDLLKSVKTRRQHRLEFSLFLGDFYDGLPVVLISHIHNVRDLSGLYLESGEGIGLEFTVTEEEFKVLGQVDLPSVRE